MSDSAIQSRIIAVDFSPDTVFVTFNGGVLVRYDAEFLFSVKNHEGNKVVSMDANTDETLPSEA